MCGLEIRVFRGSFARGRDMTSRVSSKSVLMRNFLNEKVTTVYQVPCNGIFKQGVRFIFRVV